MVASAVFLVVLALSHVVFSNPCTYTDSKGNFYDLSPLTQCMGNGYSVPAPTDDGPFYINVCNAVGECNNAAAVCQSIGYNAGSSFYASFADNGGNGVVLTYSNGDNGGCSSGRQSIITFTCDPSASTPNFTFVSEHPSCTYNFAARSKYACPTAKAPQVLPNCVIDVYLVPHSHDDVGWLETIDGYYQGSVKHILDTVVSSLMANPARKFIQVEQAYFWRWWNDPNTSDQQRAEFVKIYQNGQIEFVIGGWVMQDEACTTYGGDIDQMTLGHQFIFENFKAVPTKGWQIDPFGASSVTPTLQKLMGFDAHLIDRVTNKVGYQMQKSLQFNWIGSPSLGESSSLFTTILNGNQNAYCDWFNILDFTNTNINSGNIQQYANNFYGQAQSRRANILSNVVLAEWGCDFQFTNATQLFENMDLLMAYFQQNENTTGIRVQYATLSEYYSALWAASSGITYPTTKYTDFFPLDEGDFWTGYYTSRTTLKGLVRVGEAAAHAAEPMFALSKALLQNWNNATATQMFANITTLRLANADAQHHDGVTGTSNPNVVQMYEDNLIDGAEAALATLANIVSSYISNGKNPSLLTDSQNALSGVHPGQVVPVVFYNPLGWERNDIVSLPVDTQSITVIDSYNRTITSQIGTNHFHNANATYNVYFQVYVPPLGYATYFIVADTDESEEDPSFSAPDANTVLSNGVLNVTISASTGRISSIQNVNDSSSVTLDQNLLSYTSAHSGAYVFSPSGPASPVTTSAPSNTFQTGPIFSEVFQNFPTGSSRYNALQVVRVYSSAIADPFVTSFVEIGFQIGVLPSHTEIVTSFATSLQNGRTFYTDDNGFEFLQRVGTSNVSIEGNYYPTIYASYIEDSKTRVTIVSERTHGVSSQSNGQIELMVHRNPAMGDGWGPSLTDHDVVYPTVRVVVASPSDSPLQTRIQPILLNFPLVPLVAAPISSVNSWQNVNTAQFLSAPLPHNVHLLSLNSLDSASNYSIFRLTHLFAEGEDPVFSQPVSIDVLSLFSPRNITLFVETTLTANAVLVNPAPTNVTLSPKEIRTFVIQF